MKVNPPIVPEIALLITAGRRIEISQPRLPHVLAARQLQTLQHQHIRSTPLLDLFLHDLEAPFQLTEERQSTKASARDLPSKGKVPPSTAHSRLRPLDQDHQHLTHEERNAHRHTVASARFQYRQDERHSRHEAEVVF